MSATQLGSCHVGSQLRSNERFISFNSFIPKNVPIHDCFRKGGPRRPPGRTHGLVEEVTCKSSNGRSVSGRGRMARQAGTSTSPLMTGPLEIKVESYVSDLERTLHPNWQSFCGSMTGSWQGQYAAFSPATGQAEPLTKDANGGVVYELLTYTVENRIVDPETKVDRVMRRSITAVEVEQLRRAASEPSNPGWKETQVHSADEGVVVFDGGSYFAGPKHLLPGSLQAEDEEEVDLTDAQRRQLEALVREDVDEAELARREERLSSRREWDSEKAEEGGEAEGVLSEPDVGWEEPRKVSELEACLFWGGESRVRLQVTLDVGRDEKGELDILPVRIAMVKERWECVPEGVPESCILATDAETSLVQAERLDPDALTDRWATFDMIALPIMEQDPETGEPRQSKLYYTQEAQQEWSAGSKLNEASGGFALWLPGGIMLELRSVPAVSRGPEGDEQEGMASASPGEGLLISVLWQAKANTVIGLQRQHSEDGELLEVRSCTAMRGERKGV
eukprot:jgi/Botrbrau1/14358/Bobra.0014s0013.1